MSREAVLYGPAALQVPGSISGGLALVQSLAVAWCLFVGALVGDVCAYRSSVTWDIPAFQATTVCLVRLMAYARRPERETESSCVVESAHSLVGSALLAKPRGLGRTQALPPPTLFRATWLGVHASHSCARAYKWGLTLLYISSHP
jgi:hypothetical protein